jgi:hypothetical protein
LLEESNNSDDREYSEDADQIREVLIHAHYLSQKDIEICAAFDWRTQEKLEMHTNAPGIDSLHQTLRATYAETGTPSALVVIVGAPISLFSLRCPSILIDGRSVKPA